MNGTFLAFDFGINNIGVAIGQYIIGIAHPLDALKARNGVPNWNLIKRLFKEWKPDKVIVGLPLNIDGTDQSVTVLARKFANRVRGRFGVVVKLHDERLSTAEARGRLFELGGFRALNNKGSIDSVSAVVILESYFNQEC